MGISGMPSSARNAYLKTQGGQGSKVFLSFGNTRFPSPEGRASCGDCVFITQHGKDGESSPVHEFDREYYNDNNGVFSWISPKSYNCGMGVGFAAPGSDCDSCDSWRPCNRDQDKSKMWPARFYPNKRCQSKVCVGIAFAGFRAIYSSHGVIKRSVDTLKETLKLCEENNVFLCQVQTWNDLKEGTGIEPSFYCDDHGDDSFEPHAFLNVLKEFKR